MPNTRKGVGMDQQMEKVMSSIPDGGGRPARERMLANALVAGLGLKTEPTAKRLLWQAARALGYADLMSADSLLAATSVLVEMQPTSGAEAMLAVQMVAVHEAALRLMNRAATAGAPAEVADADIGRAERLLRLFTDQAETMQRLKGKAGQQRVTVEHVHVHEGGQAIVGGVTVEKASGRGGA